MSTMEAVGAMRRRGKRRGYKFMFGNYMNWRMVNNIQKVVDFKGTTF